LLIACLLNTSAIECLLQHGQDQLKLLLGVLEALGLISTMNRWTIGPVLMQVLAAHPYHWKHAVQFRDCKIGAKT